VFANKPAYSAQQANETVAIGLKITRLKLKKMLRTELIEVQEWSD